MMHALLELLSRLELPNLFLTKEALYRLSYNSVYYLQHWYYIAYPSLKSRLKFSID